MCKKTLFLISLVSVLCLVGSSSATTFYVDPVSGSMSNDGSESSPWSTLEAVFDNNKIETKDKNGNPKNQGAPVKAGDTLLLLSGYHGDIYESVYFNDDYITIEAASGATAELKRFRLSGGKKWIIRGLDISPSNAVTFERVTIVLFYSRNTSDGTCSDMIVEDCNVYTIADSSGWSANDWDTKACNGITLGMQGGTGLIARNNHLLNVNHGFNLEAPNALAEDNIVENFSGDGIRAVYHDVAAKYNLIKNCYNVNDNHDDGIQSFLVNVGPGAVYRVNLIGNIIINTSNPSQPYQGTLQGIGIFDGPFYDFVVENNLVLTNHWHGITLLNSQNAKIVNNTVFNKWYYDYDSDMYTWIEITAGSTNGGNLVRNNIAHTFDTAGDGNATVDNNLTFSRTADDPSIWFVDYSNFDMYTVDANSPQVDAGSGVEAPSTDIDGYPRPSGAGYDIGCYEYGVAGNISPVADAGPDQTVVDSDDNGSETVSLDGSGSYDSDGTIESYVWKEDGSQIATGVTPNVVFDVNYHEVTLEVTDNEAATGTDTVIIIVNSPTAVTSTGTWQSFSIASQTGSFTFEYDTRPNNNSMDGVTGLSQGDAAAYSDLACIVRFNTSGNMDVRNGGDYGADATLSYSAGTNYHVRMEIDISSHIYDVYVTPEGQSEVTLATDYAFRTEQGSVTSLVRWVIIRESGSHMVDNATVSGGPPPPPGQASNPSPADDATDVSVDADLSWTAGSGADSHDVYFGTTSPGDSQGNQSFTTFDPGTMANDMTYYWRIDEVNTGGTTTGVVWSFTTESPAAALPWSDGFESGDLTTGGWTTSGTASASDKAEYTGTYGAKVAKTSWMEKAISTVGFTTIHVKYARKTKGLDSGEYLYVEWYDGNSWNSLESTQDKNWALKDLICGTGADNNASFKLRFRTNGSNASEYAYIDDVEITGTQ